VSGGPPAAIELPSRRPSVAGRAERRAVTFPDRTADHLDLNIISAQQAPRGDPSTSARASG
jgi:hypothetical protein